VKRVLLFLLLASSARAWDFRGHRVVVELAWDYLSPATRTWVENCLVSHSDPRARSPQLAATWADGIRDQRPESKLWHYINQPIGQVGGHQANPENVVWAIEHFREQAAIQAESELRAEALAFLIHLVGDVHQPLHAAEFFSDEFPAGDQGGGRVRWIHPWANSLHQYWDQCAQSPLLTVAELKQQVLTTSSATAEVNQEAPAIWAQESAALARQWAYPDGQPLRLVTDEQEQQIQRICHQRLLMASLRLANLLRKLGPEAHLPTS
jgi:hypothetical protein